MAGDFRDYQLQCIEAIAKKINAKEKNISIVVPPGFGETGLAISFAKEYLTDNENVAFVVNSMVAYSQLLRMVNSSNGLKTAKVLKIRDYLANQTGFEYVFFFDLGYSERKQVQNHIKHSKTISLSFSSPDIVLSNKGNSMAPLLAVCVYGTKSVLDIRDVRYAGQSEIDYVRKDIELTKAFIEQKREEEKRKKAELEKENQIIQEKIDRFEEQRHTRRPSGWGSAIPSLVIDETPRLKEELKQNQTKIDFHNMTVEDLVVYAEMATAMLGMRGVSSETIYKAYQKIRPIKKETEKLMESNLDDKDAIFKKAQDKIIEIIENELSPEMIQLDNNYYRAILIDELSEHIWNRLDERSQRFLVTAKVTYDNFQRLNNDQLDYSGVCLLVTKAVEVEIATRYFLNYKNYLSRTHKSVSEWPYALREKQGGNPTEIELSDNHFSLGDVVYIVGRKTVYDENKKQYCYPVKHEKTKREFEKYAKVRLYNMSNEHDIKKEIEKAYRFVEKIRIDYRNPSAHKDSISSTSATECMNYVIDVHHMLKEILTPMRF